MESNMRKGLKILLGLCLALLSSGLFSIHAQSLRLQADKILVEKSARKLSLLKDGKVFKTYKVSLGREPVGPKVQQGDGKTPEGKYLIDAKNSASRYHRSLHLSYPNEKDRAQAQKLGVSPGGMIMIHGLPNGLSGFGVTHQLVDWTDGCIAVTDEEIEEIDDAVQIGTEVEIRP